MLGPILANPAVLKVRTPQLHAVSSLHTAHVWAAGKVGTLKNRKKQS